MKLFGTDGIRGRVNSDPMTPEKVLKVGMAAAKVLKKRMGKNTILIGKDTRLSGYMIESALTSGICSMGMNVTLVGPLPTPGVAYLTRALRLDAGIVISASHNPYFDNGIKFFSHDGFKLPDQIEAEIENLVAGDELSHRRSHFDHIGKAFRLDDATGRYIEYIKSTIPRGLNLEGLRVVVDTANGAAYRVTPLVLRELGAEVISISDKPDGTNINENCGSLHMDALRDAVLSNDADVGIAHDGDADRTLFCDEQGRSVDGDCLMGILATGLHQEGALMGSTVVTTVMSNLGLEHYLANHGVDLVRTAVGDRFVVEKMREGRFNFGGEQSGHIIFLDLNSTGDGPITAVQVLHLLKKKRKSLSALVQGIPLYPQILRNVEVKKKRSIDSVPSIMKAIEKVTRELGSTGRVLVRPSGTESKIRIMVEGKNARLISRCAGMLEQVVLRAMSR
ncbi:MAG: phosphoglucosamine mutase [Thermodesulfovibrionales bacterium]